MDGGNVQAITIMRLDCNRLKLMSNLHPLIAQALSPFGPVPATAAEHDEVKVRLERLAADLAALKDYVEFDTPAKWALRVDTTELYDPKAGEGGSLCLVVKLN